MINYSKGFFKPLDGGNAYRGIQNANKHISVALIKTAQKGVKNPPSTGRIYIINGRAHKASAQGEYPANRSGRLKKSIKADHDKLEFEFGSDISYAVYLQQYKTAQDRSSGWKKIAPRPFLTLAHDAVKGNFQWLMYSRVNKDLGL